MIDLAATRAQLLAELGATAEAAPPPLDPSDPSFVSAERLRARLVGPSRDALFRAYFEQDAPPAWLSDLPFFEEAASR